MDPLDEEDYLSDILSSIFDTDFKNDTRKEKIERIFKFDREERK
jgi:hypothetical protein